MNQPMSAGRPEAPRRMPGFCAVAGLALTLVWPLPGGGPEASQATAVDLIPGGGRTAQGRTSVSRPVAITGGAWYADNTPIPGARVRLRNVSTGRIEARAIADEAGRFTFDEVPPGSYAVELVNEDGKVLTVGHRFTLAAGATIATFVRLGTRAPWFNGFFSNAAAAVAAAAAAAGVTAIAPEVVRPVSATQ